MNLIYCDRKTLEETDPSLGFVGTEKGEVGRQNREFMFIFQCKIGTSLLRMGEM